MGRALVTMALVLVIAGIAVLYCIVRIHRLETENDRLHNEIKSLQTTIEQKEAELGDLQVRVEILEKGTVSEQNNQ